MWSDQIWRGDRAKPKMEENQGFFVTECAGTAYRQIKKTML